MNRGAIIYGVCAATLVALNVGFVSYRNLAHAGDKERDPQRLYVVPPHGGLEAYPGEWKFTRSQGLGAYSMVEITAAEARPGWPAPGHVHTREDESWYVIEGELEFQVGDLEATASPGTLVYAPRNVPHRYHVSKAPARYLLFFTPGGIEPLFVEVAELQKKLDRYSPEYRAELEKLQAKYGAHTAHGWREEEKK
jgi:mannose-6-phosphate isomerase-like protein (cupin superfamily)